MKIAIDLGHGVGQDRGAVGVIAEETIINNVGALVIKKLRAMGHTVVEVRPGSATTVTNSLSQRTTKANNNGVDLYVSIHANAGGGRGTEVYTYGARQLTQAKNVLNNIVALGFNNRGIKDGSNLYVIKHTKASAMLIEVCFVDTKSDIDLYTNLSAGRVSDAIVKGLVGSTTNVSAPSSAPASAKEFKVRVDISDLRIRAGAGTSYKTPGYIPKGTYTIVETKSANGYTWGKLKSGAGWIALEYTKRV